MTVVWLSMVVGRSVAGLVVVDHEFYQGRSNLGLRFRFLTDPIVPQRLSQPKKSCAGVDVVAGLLRMLVVTPGRVTVVIVTPFEILIEVLVTNL